MFMQGVYQSMGATDTVRLICAMHLITGKIGRPGSSPFSITGQTTAMSNREAGGSSALCGLPQLLQPGPRRRAGTAVERTAGTHSGTRHHGHHVQQGPAADHRFDGRHDAQRHAQGVLGGLYQSGSNAARSEQVLFLSQLQQSDAPIRRGAGHLYDPMESSISPTCFCRRRCGARRPAPIPAPSGASISACRRYCRRVIRAAAQLRCVFRLRHHQDGRGQAGGIGRPRYQDAGGGSLINYTDPGTGVRGMEAGVDRPALRHERHDLCALAANNGMAWPSTPANPYGGKRLYTNGVFNTNWDRAQYGKTSTARVDRSGQPEPRLSVGGGLCRAARGAGQQLSVLAQYRSRDRALPYPHQDQARGAAARDGSGKLRRDQRGRCRAASGWSRAI